MPDRVYDARAIANYLIANTPHGLDALQVMKIAYIAHGFTLGLTGKPLLEDDIEAWKLGPVVRRIYQCLPGGAATLTEPLAPSVATADLQADEQKIVDGVLGQYGKLSGLYLSTLTHKSGSPWDKTWRTYGKNAVIPQAVIREHYKGIIAKWRAANEGGRTYFTEAL